MVSSLLAALLLAVGVQAAELEGVQLEERAQVDGQALELNGIGLRTRYLFKVYVAGLYLPQKVSSPQTAIEGPGPKRIVLVMLRDASAEQFCDSVGAGLDANHSEAELEKIQPQIDALFAKIRAIGEAKKGMRIVLDYSPSPASTMLYIDGAGQGDPIRGREFFRGLLRIWLGDRPAEAELKRMLLRQEINGKE
jgi:chalcone isomerase-like protein